MATSHLFFRIDMQHSFFVMILCPFLVISMYAKEGMDFNTTKMMMCEFGNDPSDTS